jgi:hypothetical protein
MVSFTPAQAEPCSGGSPRRLYRRYWSGKRSARRGRRRPVSGADRPIPDCSRALCTIVIRSEPIQGENPSQPFCPRVLGWYGDFDHNDYSFVSSFRRQTQAECDLMNLPQTGGCQCGAVRYEITQAPIMVYTCHCTDCQRMTSSAFSLGCVLPDGAFRLVRGEPKGVQRTTGAAGACPPVGSAPSAACGSAPLRGPARPCATCGVAPWTTPPGCDRPLTSGPAAGRSHDITGTVL